jgi:hypothetical protein
MSDFAATDFPLPVLFPEQLGLKFNKKSVSNFAFNFFAKTLKQNLRMHNN